MNEKHILYLTVNLVNRKIYIGVHQTESDEFDGYLGCGVRLGHSDWLKKPKTPFQYAVKKYGIKNFKRITLLKFDNKKDAYEMEAKIVDLNFITRTDVYNIAIGGIGGANLSQLKSVNKYGLDGIFIESFDSINQAGRSLGRSNGSHICRAIRRDGLCDGFQWSYDKVEMMKIYEKKELYNQKTVVQMTPDGKIIKEWSSMSECKKEFTNIKKVLNGSRETTKGFSFQYKEDYDMT